MTMATVEQMHREVEASLNDLRPIFQPACQLTFIMRLPGYNEADVLITNDSIDELKNLLDRFKARTKGVES